MGLLGEIVWHLLGMAGSYYLMAALIVLTRCIYDEGIVWNQKKKYFLLLLAAASEGITFLNDAGYWNVPNGISFVLFCAVYVIIHVYGCRKSLIKRSLRGAIMLLFVGMCFFMICDIGGYYIIPEYQIMRTAGMERHREDWIMNWEMFIVFAVVYYYFIYCVFNKGIFIPFGKKEKWLTVFYCLYIICIYVLVVVSFEDKNAQAAAIQTVMAFLMILLSMIFPVFIYKNRASAYYMELKEYQEAFLQAELAHFRQYKEAQEETRRFRHDIHNNLECLHMLLEENKTAQASDYLSGMLHDVQILSPKIVTGDEILDCIISAKWNQMKQAGISFQLEGLLDNGLHWKAVDICSVFANALDNAIEACQEVPVLQERQIFMSIKHTKQFYYIEIINAVQKKIDCNVLLNSSQVYTSKKNRNLHGFGFRNMQRTVEKYNGFLRIDCDNCTFRLTLTISR